MCFAVLCVLCHSRTCSALSPPLHEGISSPLLFAGALPPLCCGRSRDRVRCCAGAGTRAAVPPAQWQLHLASLEMWWSEAVVATKVLRTGQNAGEGQRSDDTADIPSSVAYADCLSLAHSLPSGRVTSSCLGRCGKQCQTARTHTVLSAGGQQRASCHSKPCCFGRECGSAAESQGLVLCVPTPSLKCLGSPGLCYFSELSKYIK